MSPHISTHIYVQAYSLIKILNGHRTCTAESI